jgi:hypothetical protein
MIRNENKYKEAVARLGEERERLKEHARRLKEAGLERLKEDAEDASSNSVGLPAWDTAKRFDGGTRNRSV